VTRDAGGKEGLTFATLTSRHSQEILHGVSKFPLAGVSALRVGEMVVKKNSTSYKEGLRFYNFSGII